MDSNKESLQKFPAKELFSLSYPKCAKNCLAFEYFGCCECEAICPHKFDKNGKPKND